ncbi:hypothetical protein D3C71_1508670 [compost metagenome]
MKIIVPFSTAGSSASCRELLKRCTSSRNRIVFVPYSDLSICAFSITARTSFTDASTAFSRTNSPWVWFEMIWANVVLPQPGGPYSKMEETWSASMALLSSLPCPTICSWPIYSSSRVGRIRSARSLIPWSDSCPYENKSMNIHILT